MKNSCSSSWKIRNSRNELLGITGPGAVIRSRISADVRRSSGPAQRCSLFCSRCLISCLRSAGCRCDGRCRGCASAVRRGEILRPTTADRDRSVAGPRPSPEWTAARGLPQSAGRLGVMIGPKMAAVLVALQFAGGQQAQIDGERRNDRARRERRIGEAVANPLQPLAPALQSRLISTRAPPRSMGRLRVFRGGAKRAKGAVRQGCTWHAHADTFTSASAKDTAGACRGYPEGTEHHLVGSGAGHQTLRILCLVVGGAQHKLPR